MESSGHAWLPTEVVEEILEATWNSTISADERKSLLSAFARADPVLHGLLTRAATRFVILDVTGFNTDDLDLYAALADRAATEAGADVDSEPALNSYYNIEVPGGDVLAFRADIFKNSHLCIEGLTGAGDQPHRHRNVPDPHRYTWGYVLVKLTNIIPDAQSLTLASSPNSLWPVAKQIVPALLFPTLRSFPSLRSVHFSVFFEVLNFASHSAAPPPVAQVTSLRLTHVPTCECSKRDSRPRRADGHLECCLSATLLECFPNLQHLHLENSVFLKTLYPPASLRMLTLDAPPVQRIEGREPFSSLLEYNLAAAVKRGFMAAPVAADRDEGDSEDRPRRRKIVVRTGAGEPFGWMAAQAACNEAEIELVQAVVYAEPDVRVDSVLELGAVKGSSAGSVLKSPTVLEAAKMTAV